MSWNATRELFPVTRSIVYLNHAGVAPVSTRVGEALARYAALASEEGAFNYPLAFESEVERVRGQAACLLGATPEEIAFVKNTTEGLGFVASGIPWQPGDKVLTCDLEYPSNVYPWQHLASLGAETVLLPGEGGRLPIERVDEALRDPAVRLLSLSSVEFGSGARNDLGALGRLCREREVLFCVDGIQSVGLFPLDVKETPIDFLSADGHKWMLSSEGCGIFFCRRERIPTLRPVTVGWGNVTSPHDYDHYNLELPDTAKRFEEGSPNLTGIFGLGAALDLLLELGIDAISQRVLELNDYLAEGLEARGATITSPRAPQEQSGSLCFLWPNEAPTETYRRLRRERIFVAARRGAVRVSPHFYNNQEDLDRLLTALEGG